MSRIIIPVAISHKVHTIRLVHELVLYGQVAIFPYSFPCGRAMKLLSLQEISIAIIYAGK